MAHRVTVLKNYGANYLDANKTSGELIKQQEASHTQHRAPRVTASQYDRCRRPRRSKHHHQCGGGTTPTSLPKEVGQCNECRMHRYYLA